MERAGLRQVATDEGSSGAERGTKARVAYVSLGWSERGCVGSRPPRGRAIEARGAKGSVAYVSPGWSELGHDNGLWRARGDRRLREARAAWELAGVVEGETSFPPAAGSRSRRSIINGSRNRVSLFSDG